MKQLRYPQLSQAFAKALCLLCIAGLLISTPVFSQGAAAPGTVSGKLTDGETGEPLIGANVVLLNTFNGSSTGLDGGFSFEAPAGTYTLRATYIGYATQEVSISVSAGQTTNIDISLSESIAEFGETVVVIGSRSERTAIESPVPVDVIDELAVRESPQTELNQVLRDLAPSFNASHQTISDGTDHVNPASLRGLGPDQVLVLVNGKRRHTSAIVHVNGTFGRGTVGVDMNAIPKASVQRIEVLRDGAAAQYGSDAIAGVINVVLKEQTDGLQINAGVGANNLLTNNNDISDPANSVDGVTQYVNANYGVKIGDQGFFNVTVDYLNRNRTNRSNFDSRDMFPGISGEQATDAEIARRGLTRDDFSMKTGQGNAEVASSYYNLSIPLGGNAEIYSFGGLTYRNGNATGFYRRPVDEARVDLGLYPNGFLPQIHTKINDQAFTAGVKGVQNGWIIDGSVTHGGNSFLYNIENTMNASIGAASPVSFDAGRLKFKQTTGNIDILKSLDTGGKVKSLNLGLGGEVRVENYQIEAGQFESYSLGNGGDIPGVDFDTTATGAPKNSGSQVFAGFQPSNEVNRFRNSIGLYGDLESDISDKLFVGIAGRYEYYNDFGSTLNGKVAARLDVGGGLALRGAVSSGFRAPNLNQLWFNNVSIQFVLVNGELVPARVLSASNADPVTRAFGVPQLKEETSVNLSGGFTWRASKGFSLTADYYNISINDRIVLSSRFSVTDPNIGSIVADILEPFSSQGVSQAQFFMNAVDTRTQGVDVVAAYNTRAGQGRLTLTLAGNVTKTEVQQVNIPQGVADVFAGGDLAAVSDVIFNREEKNRLEDALPRTNAVFTARYALSKLAITARANYFGSVEYKPTNSTTLSDGSVFFTNDETFGAKTTLDLDFTYQLTHQLSVSLGANNILNTFPDTHGTPAERTAENPNLSSNYSNGRFVYSRRVTQFGMNGGFYYARFGINL